MDRDIPNYNPLVNGKIQHKNMQLHYQRLHSIKVLLVTCRVPYLLVPHYVPAVTKPALLPSCTRKNARQPSRRTTSCSSIR